MININSSAPRAATAENPIEEPQPTEEPRPTEGPQPTKVHSSPAKGNRATINPAEREESVYPRHYREISPHEMMSMLAEKDSLDAGWLEKANGIDAAWNTGRAECIIRLNDISSSIYQHMKPAPEYRIEFIETPSVPPKDHPTGTEARPDFVAYKKYPDDLARTPAWSHIEPTGELWSKKSTIHDSQSQAAAYAAYHLQARPDLVSVAGMWITKSQFSIFFVNACRVYVSNHIKLKDQMAGPLLYAFVWYLYHPQLDKSVFIDTRVDPPKFSITLSEGQEFSNLKLKFTGSIPGRRTTVYICDSNPGLVIKEQYIEKARRFFEGTLLQKIHSQGEFPGVVRIDKYEPVRNNNQDVTVSYGDSIRFKTRLVLKDMGEPLMEVKKVGELLMALYDFLEITRMLHRTSQIYHRDLSPGNLLVTKDYHPFDENMIKLENMGFSHCLFELAESVHQFTQEERTRTWALLTDFDSGEDRAPSKGTQTNRPMSPIGTPAFMAHVVRNLRYPGGLFKFPPMPPVCLSLLPRYKALYPDRVTKFLPNEKPEEDIIELEDENLPPEEFRHLLRYDAESVFWIILFWSTLAQPATSKTKSQISSQAWQSLISLDDKRYDNYINTSGPIPLHPEYSPMSKLLKNMHQHLKCDLKFAKDEVRRKDPEYLHEVFQRLILNFMADPDNQEFLKLEKHVQDREVEPMIGGGGSSAKMTTKSTMFSSHKSTEFSSPMTQRSKQGNMKPLSSSPGGSNVEASEGTSRAGAKRNRDSSSNSSEETPSSEEEPKSKKPRQG